MDAFKPVRDFEAALCDYTGAPYAVAVNSCSMALLLAVAWHVRVIDRASISPHERKILFGDHRPQIEIPCRTYLSVPMSIIHAGGRPTFRDQKWEGWYELRPLHVIDSARFFTSGMYRGKMRMWDDRGAAHWTERYGEGMYCVSFHHSKTLGDTQGGAILHDNPEADAWLRRARFDGRTEGVNPKDDKPILGWHCYMSPDVAARLTWKLSKLPRHNPPLPSDDYPDLSTLEIFK